MIGTTESKLVSAGPAYEATGLVHRVREPAAPSPHPTVIMLHGRSGDENVMWVFARTVPKDWLLIAPRAIKPDPDGGYAWHPRRPDEWPTLAMFEEGVTAVAQMILSIPELYSADPEQIYLMGFSQGAALAYALAFRHPGWAKGIAGLVSFMPTESEAVMKDKPLTGLPVFMAVGRRDSTIPLHIARVCSQILRQAGALVEYHEYDTGHKLDAQGMRDLSEWWKKRA
jgi:phospholipase/carboxylesterase